MIPSWRCWWWKLCSASSLAIAGAIIAASGNCAKAQITPDGTLGAESSQVTSPTPGAFQINGGATRDTNLFHSFSQFSVLIGGAAHFNNAPDIQNIISRVTGGSISNIDGLIRANGTANLFLLNPNGIVFGPNARLDIGGSFLSSTASSINFADGVQFSATAHPTTPLLTVSVPVGLQLGETAGSILNQSRVFGLEVQPGKTLALLGGGVELDGGYLLAPGGRVELGAVAEPGTVGLAVDNFSLSYPEGVQRADVILTNQASVNVAAGDGGSIAVNARDLDVLGGSILGAGIAPEQGSVDSQAGDITLNATGMITIAGINNEFRSNIYNIVDSGAVGKGGDINILAESLSLDNARLATFTSGKGDAGSVSVRVRDSVSAVNSSILSNVYFRAEGKGGNIDIQARSLSLTDGAQLNTSTFAQGDAGSISVQVDDSVLLANSLISSTVESEAVGKGGKINIQARSLSLTDNRVRPSTGLSTSTYGQGDAGSILIQASDFVSVVNSGIFSENSSDINADGEIAVGNAGDINILTGSLSLIDNAYLSTGTYRQGDAGNIFIRARGPVSLSDSSITSSVTSSAFIGEVGPEAVGKGGDINIITQSLSLDDANLFTSTAGQGNAGNVIVQTNDSVSLNDSVISSAVQPGGVGNGGNIDIQTHDLSLTEGSQLQAAVIGERDNLPGGRGQGGNIRINATETVHISGVDADGFSSGLFTSVGKGASGQAGNIDVTARSILLDNRGKLTAETTSGQGGNITLKELDLLLLRRNSQISTTAGTAQAGGDGGNIDIDTQFLVAVPSENSDITANAFQGRGGNVRITTQGIFGTQFRLRQTPENDITASSEFGVNGVVEINTIDVDPSFGLVTLPAELVEASGLIATGCAADGENKFIVTGRGGLPPNPGDPLNGEAVLTQWATLDPEVESRSGAAPSTNPTRERAITQIVEAQGWVINNKGEVVLTAQAPNVTPTIPWMNPATCHTS